MLKLFVLNQGRFQFLNASGEYGDNCLLHVLSCTHGTQGSVGPIIGAEFVKRISCSLRE
jgi:hypothetical protein